MSSVTLLVVSGVCSICLFVLFAIEHKRGKQFIAGPREWLDQLLVSVHTKITRAFVHVGRGKTRLVFHFILHRVLSFLVAFFRECEKFFSTLLYRNKRVARKVARQKSNSHLLEIKAHKDANALSPDEKAQLKDKKLNGE